MDIELARHLMIEQQIRPWDVLDKEILELLSKVKREDYVPPVYRGLAFVDMEIPLGHGESMWPPRLEARVLQALAIKPTDRVLEVGTGSGYMTALLAARAMHVVSVEIDPELGAAAEEKLKAHGIANVHFRIGDAACDWQGDGQYDAILMTGSCPILPVDYLKRLNPGGRFFVVLGEAPVMRATLITCASPDACHRETLFETALKALRNAPEPARFQF